MHIYSKAYIQAASSSSSCRPVARRRCRALLLLPQRYISKYFCTSKQVLLHQQASTFAPASKYFCTSKRACICYLDRRNTA